MSVTSASGRMAATVFDGDGHLIRSEAELAASAWRAVERARSGGADQAMASVHESGGINVRFAGRELETASREGSQALRVTVYQGGRSGSATTEALDGASIDRAVDQAIAISSQLEPDADAGLADKAALAWTPETVPLFAPAGQTTADLAASAGDVETGALAAGLKGVRVLQAGAATRDMRWAMATSDDFCLTGAASSQERWCMALAEGDQGKVQDWWSTSERRQDWLKDAAGVGARAAERAFAKLGASDIATQRAPVLFDAVVAVSLVSDLARILTGDAQFRRMTCLPDAVGKTAAADHVRLSEDPFEPWGLASAASDGEGVAGTRRDVIAGGVVQGLFLDSRMGRKLGMASTGNASGFLNLTLSSALTRPEDDLEAMLRKLDRGLWVTEFLGGGVNPVTGVFSKAATGFWVEQGRVVRPVHNFTVAGQALEMWKGLAAVGADVHRGGAVRSGSLLIDSLQIAGR
ncbi:MAG: TldD/PmbA family protein [Brevundimonas sp.]